MAALAAIVLMRDDAAQVNSAVWTRGIIVVVTAALMLLFATRAAQGSRGAYRRLRIVSIVTVVAIAAIIASPGTFPVWLKVEQGLCGLIMAGVAVLANGGCGRGRCSRQRHRRGSDTIDQVSAAVLGDPWQTRMDRMRRLLPVPLLAVSTAGALLAPSAGGGWTARDTALVAAAAVWSVAVTARLRPDAAPRWRLVAFAVYTTLAALLVGTDTWYGVFAYSGFPVAHGLGPRWRIPAFGATALVVLAAMVGGYPTGAGKGLLTYLMVAGVMLALVINSATITYRGVEQNVDRGRMIRELAEANGRLEESMAENAALHARLVETGPGGRGGRGAAAAGPRDPRHAGPGPDRDLAQLEAAGRPCTGPNRGPGTSPRRGPWRAPT